MHQFQFFSPGVAITLRAAIAIIAAAVGGGLGIIGRKVSHRLLCALVSLAAGALLGVALVDIVPETIEILGVMRAIFYLASGFAVFWLVGRYVYFLCPACAASATEHDTGYLRLGALLIVSMSIHSTVDGLAISASYARGVESISLLVLVAVAYHKVPEGLALVSLARLAGYGRVKALLLTILVELTTALGAAIGLLMVPGVNNMLIGATLGFVAGTFLYTVGFALLKEMFVHEKGSIIFYVILGFASIVLLGFLFSRSGIHVH